MLVLDLQKSKIKLNTEQQQQCPINLHIIQSMYQLDPIKINSYVTFILPKTVDFLYF